MLCGEEDTNSIGYWFRYDTDRSCTAFSRGVEIFPSNLARPKTTKKSQLATEPKEEINRKLGLIECGGCWS